VLPHQLHITGNVAAAANVRHSLGQELISTCSMIKQQLKKATANRNRRHGSRDIQRVFKTPADTPLGKMHCVDLHMNHFFMLVLFGDEGNVFTNEEKRGGTGAFKHCHVLSTARMAEICMADALNISECNDPAKWIKCQMCGKVALLNRHGNEAFGHVFDETEEQILVAHGATEDAIAFPRPDWDPESQTHLFDNDFYGGHALHSITPIFACLSHKIGTCCNVRIMFNKIGLCAVHKNLVAHCCA